MKKKTNRQKRVLAGAVCVAAVIMAGSTFAWFTSQDEVTNRLTASADYGVSIVESFVPPAQWVPGQAINKDVYAVNTGNIDAFVKEDISGKLTFTYEKLESAPNTTTGVELSSTDIALTEVDGATTMEAGAFLAWTNTNEPLGVKNSQRASESETDVSGERWTPSASGVYIFRRSIGTETSGSPAVPTTVYTYAGYYFSGNKYYKIVIGEDDYPAAETGAAPNITRVYDVNVKSNKLGSGVTTGENGLIVGSPQIKYVTEGKINNADVNLKYDSSGHRLVATYAVNEQATVVTGTAENGGVGNTYDASAMAARNEIDYQNKKAVSDAATAAYNEALAKYTYAKALADARNTLVDAAAAAKTAGNNYTSAATSASNAESAVNAAAAELTQNLNGNSIKYNTIADAVASKMAELNASTNYPQTYANYNQLKSIWEEMYGTNGSGGYYGEITTALAALKDESNTTITAANARANLQKLTTNLNNLVDALGRYESKFANLKAAASGEGATTATGLALDSAGTVAASINTIKTDGTAMSTAITVVNGLSDKVAAYTTAQNTLDNLSNTASTDWENALSTYNSTVLAAKNTFTTAGYTDDSNIAATYSANSDGGNGTITPQLAPNTNLDTFTVVTITVPTEAEFNVGDSGSLTTDMNNAVTATNAAKNALDDSTETAALDNPITIYINLDATNVEANWDFDNNTDDTTKASFYLKHILEAGATSERLVDSVELANTTTARSFKDLTFDLNVGLKSAQVTYADDQVTITSSAVDGDNDFAMKPTAITQADKTVTWATPAP